MSIIVASLQGRFGNQCLSYLFCRALADKTGSELRVVKWVGEQIFDLEAPRPPQRPLQRYDAKGALQWSEMPEDARPDIEIRDYCQFQEAMIYTKRQAMRWLRLRSEVAAGCKAAAEIDNRGTAADRIVCHLRRGDYIGYGYPVVSQASFNNACDYYGLDKAHPGAVFLSEEDPTPTNNLVPDEIAFAVDFYRMIKAPTLLRANSTFSWLAALLSDGLILSPVIEGLEGGKVHDCRFVPGNWPRLANMDFTTDLHTAP